MKLYNFILIVFIFTKTTHSDECALPSSSVIHIYGEKHGSQNADRLWQKLFTEAERGKTRLLLEALKAEANTDLNIKGNHLRYVTPNVTPAHLNNIFGIDSEILKTVDVFGIAYIDILTNRSSAPYSLQVVINTLADPFINFEILKNPFLDQRLEKLRSQIKESSLYQIQRILTNTDRRILSAFLLESHERAIVRAKTIFSDVHDESVSPLNGSPRDYIFRGIEIRDRYMAKQIQTLACQPPAVREISVIVGIDHLQNLKRELSKLMPQNLIKTTNIEK